MIAVIRRLERRREALVARSGAQRAWISARLAPAARRLAAADRFAATLRMHPVVTGIAVAGLALIGPRRLLRWALRAVPIYSLLARL